MNGWLQDFVIPLPLVPGVLRWGDDEYRTRTTEVSDVRPSRLALFLIALLIPAAPASAAVPHVVQPGETLWSIAAANNLTTRTVAAYNGLSESAQVVLGSTVIQKPGSQKLITAPLKDNITNTEQLGLVLYTQYVFFFQAAGLVLLVAMIGAIVLTLRHRVRVKRQSISAQNARTKATAIEVRQVQSGQGLSS